MQEFREVKPGLLRNFDETVEIYDSIDLLREKTQTILKYKSPVTSKKRCFVSSNDGVELDWLLESEAGKKSYFRPEYFELVENLPGCNLYLASSATQDTEHDDGGILVAEFGSKIFLMAPLTFCVVRFRTDLSVMGKAPSTCKIKQFWKIIQEIQNYQDCEGVSSEEVLEHLGAVL